MASCSCDLLSTLLVKQWTIITEDKACMRSLALQPRGLSKNELKGQISIELKKPIHHNLICNLQAMHSDSSQVTKSYIAQQKFAMYGCMQRFYKEIQARGPIKWYQAFYHFKSRIMMICDHADILPRTINSMNLENHRYLKLLSVDYVGIYSLLTNVDSIATKVVNYQYSTSGVFAFGSYSCSYNIVCN